MDSLNSDTILSMIMNETDLSNNLMIFKKKYENYFTYFREAHYTAPEDPT